MIFSEAFNRCKMLTLISKGMSYHILTPLQQMERIPYYNVLFLTRKSHQGSTTSIVRMNLGNRISILSEMRWNNVIMTFKDK